MRRLVATGKPEELADCIAFLGELKDSTVRRKALDGLTIALQGRLVDAPEMWKAVFAELVKDQDAEVQRLARRLAVNFRDRAAVQPSVRFSRGLRGGARLRRGLTSSLLWRGSPVTPGV